MLIRSTAENLKHNIPFVEMMQPLVQKFNLGDLCSLNRYKRFEDRKYFREDECGMKDETLKEDKLNEYVSNKLR